MIREHSTSLTRLHRSLDLLLVVFSFIVAYTIKRNFFFPGREGLSTEPNYYLVLLVIVLLAPFFFRVAGFYQSYRTQTFYQIGLRVGKAVVGILAGTIIVLYLQHAHGVSRMLLLIFGVLLGSLLLLSKSLLYYTLRHYRARDYNTRNVLIIGTGLRAQRMIQSLQRQKSTGYRIVGCLDPYNKETISTSVSGEVKVIGQLNTLPTLLLEQVIDEVIFASDLGDIDYINEYILFAEELGINIHIVPDFQLEKIMYRPETATVFMHEFAGLPTIAISTVPQRPGELLLKSWMDYLVAGCGLIVLSPLFLTLIIIIRATSRGSAFFTQERCGLYGRTFKVIKFRTMVNNAEQLQNTLKDANEVDGPVFKISNDPRITGIGKFLRKTSLDELPQLINIMAGHMSLVGPRPPIPAEVLKYKPWQRRRLSMKPGITCIWQVSGRNNIDFEDWMRLDLEYIDNWSLLLDIKILCKTVKEVLSCNGQ